MIGSNFADHYEVLADWVSGLLEVDITAGKIRVLQDTTYDGKIMVVDLEKNFAVQLEVTTFDYPHVKELIEATRKGEIKTSQDVWMDDVIDELKNTQKKKDSLN
tara:strand:- start:549 stop:860 length:312 start_codon:yes stop_codon:yes gene_type:complete